jgi:hypothetical protein
MDVMVDWDVFAAVMMEEKEDFDRIFGGDLYYYTTSRYLTSVCKAHRFMSDFEEGSARPLHHATTQRGGVCKALF